MGGGGGGAGAGGVGSIKVDVCMKFHYPRSLDA